MNPIIKYLIVGGFNTIAAYTIFFILVSWKVHYPLAVVFTTAVIIINSYYWNSKWTFALKNNWNLIAIIKFGLIYMFSATVNILLLIYFVELLNYDPRIAQLFCQIFATIINYLGQRYFCFRSFKNEVANEA